jgi:penicillin G amidase
MGAVMTRRTQFVFCMHLLAVFVISVSPVRADQIELLRDPWGIPHIIADTDAGAFYGLGYATAEDRSFQMTYSLRTIQGRLSEVVGEVRQLNRNETSLDHDRKMRTFGFHRAAQRAAASLDADTGTMLQAYCDGVNDWFREHKEELHPLFAQTGLQPEQWTTADCLLSWWHLGQFFATDGTRKLIAGRNNPEGPVNDNTGRGRVLQRPAGLERRPPDDGPAVVKRTDVPKEWIERATRYAREHGLEGTGDGAEGPKFSHAWVVGGKRTTTGSSVLMSDPQTAVRNPSLFYEFHLQGKSFNARGIGVPGSPILLIGFTMQVAWGVTALGADQADLFQLETDEAHPNQYRFDNQWRPMTVHRETIKVKGRDPIEYTVRETHLGPVATAYCFAQAGDGEVALKRIPVCETDRETVQAAIAAMRARNARQFDAALAGWRFPSANVVFGDREGNIGYRAIAAIPVRSRLDPTSGRYARPGHNSKQDWQEILPYELMPGVMNPAAGFVYSGNHRPIESWYPIPTGAMTGGGGDTTRSWRLRERLLAKDRFTPEDVRAIHFDAVNPARRDLVGLALHLRDQQKCELSADAREALSLLEPWHHAGASSALTDAGSALAVELNTFFRIVSTELAWVYGGGESGLCYFLKTATARIESNPQAILDKREQDFIDQSLASAWQSCQKKYGDNLAEWQEKARTAMTQRRLGYYESLNGFPALDSAQTIAVPALTKPDGGTISCQTSQSYTQWVPMHDPDLAESLLPIGLSEHADHSSRTSTLKLWGDGGLHPAPLSKAKIEAIGVTRQMLDRR